MALNRGIFRFVPGLRFAPLVLALALGSSSAVLGQDPDGQAATEFRYDFRGAKMDEQLFRAIGPEPAARMKPEAEGLRITLPAEQEKPDRVGLKTTFGVRGDFTITAAYEMLRADKPRAGAGVGFLLYLLTDTPTEAGFAFFRVQRVKEGDVYVCSHRTPIGPGKRKTEDTVHPAAAASGKLRVMRSGSEVIVSVAEGGGDDFRELGRYDFGRTDLKRVEVAAYPGRAANAVDLRVTSFHARADSLPGLPAGAASNAPQADQTILPEQSGRRAIVLGLALAAALAVAFLAYLSLRRRKSVPGPIGSAGTESAPAVTFRCPGCEKVLKAKADLTGKAIKCPHCGQTASVP